MRLSTRLSFFFLGTLGLILVVFSVALHAVVSEYFRRQVDERLESALNTLVAAAEVTERGVEWEPKERRLSFGLRAVDGQFVWVVSDGDGSRIDGSTPGEHAPPFGDSIWNRAAAGRSWRITDRYGQPWRIMIKRLERSGIGDGTATASASLAQTGSGEPVGHDALILGAGISLRGIHESLRNLAVLLVILSGSTWTVALLIGGRICRRALRPVSEMAIAAHAIAGHEFDERLPVPATGDELEELALAFNGLLGRQHESHQRQRRFTGDASHQLRTPLTALQGQVDLALRQPRSVEEYRRVLEVVQERTRHLWRIIEALLFLARADAESQRPQLEPIELTGWLRGQVPLWSGPRTEDLHLDVGSDPIWIRAHRALLAEILDNLIDNACKYSEPSTPILIRSTHEGRDVRLSVEDRGIGIDHASIGSVKDPFFRTPQARSRNSKGLGLGLSVASRIAEIFEGRLEVLSHPDLGSSFSIILPAWVAPTSTPERPN